jgi:hypothetical protein
MQAAATGNRIWMVLGLFAVLILSVIAGIIAALGSKMMLVGFVGMFGAAAVAMMPIRWTLWGIWVLSFLVVGNLRYFFDIGLLHWIPYLLGLGLFVQYFMTMTAKRGDLHLPGFIVPYALFLFLAVASSVASGAPFMQIAIASKNYFFLLSILLVFASGLMNNIDIGRIWRFMLVMGVLQAPFALYQYIFVAGKRSQASVSGDFAPWDAVVGTLGGNPDGGGASQAMGVLITICIVAALAMRQEKLIRTRSVVLVIASGVLAVLLGEVKAAFLFIPIGIGMLFWRQMMRRPLESTAIALALAGMLTAMPLAYEKLHYSRTSDFRETRQQKEGLLDKIQNQLDPDRYNLRNPVLSRGALLYFWWRENGAHGDVRHTLFGYGMGATQKSRFAAGELALRYVYNLQETSASILLWETGLLGFGAYALSLLWAALQALRLARRSESAADRSYLRAAGVSLLIVGMSLPYHSFSLMVPGAQLLVMFLLAHIAYYGLRERQAAQQVHRMRVMNAGR